MKDHITHHDDCGCLSERYDKRISELKKELAKANDLNAKLKLESYELGQSNEKWAISHTVLYVKNLTLEKELADERLAFEHANTVIGKLEKDLTKAQQETELANERLTLFMCSQCGWHHGVDCDHKAELARVQQENERLTMNMQLMTAPIEGGTLAYACMKEENDKLRAEVERLRKVLQYIGDECQGHTAGDPTFIARKALEGTS